MQFGNEHARCMSAVVGLLLERDTGRAGEAKVKKAEAHAWCIIDAEGFSTRAKVQEQELGNKTPSVSKAGRKEARKDGSRGKSNTRFTAVSR